mmetsp:Transcript_4908/g.6319  ORF Transcript_4908/g.6319 Transcript_4908/m.6319 type:complete len:241 (+) Transcript_4908:154-876(+)
MFGSKSKNRSSQSGDATASMALGAKDSSDRPALIPISHLKALMGGTKKWEFKDFDLRSTVGTGTFGRVRVVKVKGSEDRTPLALKILKKSEVLRLKQVEHVKSETKILAMIEHPFIVNLLTTFQDEKRLFLVLEFVNGGELFSHLRKEGRLPNDDARFYAGEITLAFQYLHDKNIIYRDASPSPWPSHPCVAENRSVQQVPFGRCRTDSHRKTADSLLASQRSGPRGPTNLPLYHGPSTE